MTTNRLDLQVPTFAKIWSPNVLLERRYISLTMSERPATVKADDNTRQSYDQVLVDVITYVYHYQIDSSRAWSCAKVAILDAVGCALETLDESAEARAMIGPIVVGTIVPNGFRLPGTPYQMDPLKGAFDLGSLIRYLDHNDAFPGAEWGHPSG